MAGYCCTGSTTKDTSPATTSNNARMVAKIRDAVILGGWGRRSLAGHRQHLHLGALIKPLRTVDNHFVTRI